MQEASQLPPAGRDAPEPAVQAPQVAQTGLALLRGACTQVEQFLRVALRWDPGHGESSSAAENQAGVLRPKAQAIAEGKLNRVLPSAPRHVIQVALRVRVIEV